MPYSKDHIARNMQELRLKKQEIELLEKKLKSSRLAYGSLEQDTWYNCVHEWGNPVKGYEHEGVQCIHCGIGDIYNSTFRASYEREHPDAKALYEAAKDREAAG